MKDLFDRLSLQAANPSVLLSTILGEARILARRLGDDGFLTWLDSELAGYQASPPPDYRSVSPASFGRFANPEGQTHVVDFPVPLEAMPNEARAKAANPRLPHGVATLESYAADDTVQWHPEPWPPDLVKEYPRGNVKGMKDCTLVYARWRIKKEHIAHVLQRIRMALQDRLHELEEKYHDKLRQPTTMPATEVVDAGKGASEGPRAVADDLKPYEKEKQAWWTEIPDTKEVAEADLLSFAEEIDVVLITAVEVERDAVLRLLKPLPGKKKILMGFIGPETYYLGKFGAVNAVVTKCRPGSLESGAAILATNDATRLWRPRAIIMPGIAFGKDPTKQKLGDVLVASQIISYEPQRVGAEIIDRGSMPPSNPTLLNRFENRLGWSFKRPDGLVCELRTGPILSGEKLVDDPEFKAALFRRFPQAIGGEMEGVALSSAAIRSSVAWILLKAICDWGDGNKDKKHQALAAAAVVSLTHHVLSQSTVLNSLEKPR